MLNLTKREMVELLSACNSTMQQKAELICQYAETEPWKAEIHSQSLKELETAKEKIFTELQRRKRK